MREDLKIKKDGTISDENAKNLATAIIDDDIIKLAGFKTQEQRKTALNKLKEWLTTRKKLSKEVKKSPEIISKSGNITIKLTEGKLNDAQIAAIMTLTVRAFTEDIHFVINKSGRSRKPAGGNGSGGGTKPTNDDPKPTGGDDPKGGTKPTNDDPKPTGGDDPKGGTKPTNDDPKPKPEKKYWEIPIDEEGIFKALAEAGNV